MKKLLKWIGITLAGLLGLIVLAVAAVYAISVYRFSRTYDIQAEALAIPSDEEALARGVHLENTILGCTDCHGDDLGGGVVLDDPGFMRLYAPNLTAGEGGVGAKFSDSDWVRAVRHGVDPDGKALVFMPADIFNHLSSEDLAAIIAYARSFPPVDNQVSEPEIGLMGRIFITLGQLPEDFVLPARYIDHDSPIPSVINPTALAEYGAYLVSIAYCTHCHGKNLTGGPFPFPDPNAPQVPNLAAVGGWSVEQFKETLRTGVTPSGKVLDPEFMPWGDYNLTDEELNAIWQYLQTLPPEESGNR